MKKYIDFLIHLGATHEQATKFIKDVAEEAYEAGEECGQEYEPAIIGESLGKSGVDFDEWFKNQLS